MATQKKPIVRSFEMKKKNIVNRMHPKKKIVTPEWNGRKG